MTDEQSDFIERVRCCMEDRPPCGCPTPPVANQYEQSLARFNDNSAFNSANMQQIGVQTHATWAAHMLKIQHDICQVPSQAGG